MKIDHNLFGHRARKCKKVFLDHFPALFCIFCHWGIYFWWFQLPKMSFHAKSHKWYFWPQMSCFRRTVTYIFAFSSCVYIFFSQLRVSNRTFSFRNYVFQTAHICICNRQMRICIRISHPLTILALHALLFKQGIKVTKKSAQIACNSTLSPPPWLPFFLFLWFLFHHFHIFFLSSIRSTDNLMRFS